MALDIGKADEANSMSVLNLILSRRRIIRAGAAFAGFIAILLLIVALAWPRVWTFGSLQISLHNTRNSCLVTEGALLIWALTSDRTWRLLRAIRRNFSRPQQAVAAVLGVNAVLAIYALLSYPQNLTDYTRMANDDLAEPLQYKYGQVFVPQDNFAARCCAELPANARILYHGINEGWVFAYDVYPRRVFMLPSDWWHLAASCHLKPWFSYLPSDPLEAYWHRAATSSANERDTFIREHGITHEVFFDAQNPAACRWEAVR